MTIFFSAAFGFIIVGLVTLVAIFGWGGRVTALQRFALCAIAAGLTWAGPARMLGETPGLGDLLFLGGLLLYLGSTYGPALHRRADALDGRLDGRVTLWGHRQV